MDKKAAIGIFDSGTGGLTVTKAITKLLPGEDIVYFGDTAHLPYGEKSKVSIQGYVKKITDFLLNKNCKIIVIACNSASVAAFELLKQYTVNRAEVIDVVSPMVQYIGHHFPHQNIGLIGTKQTILSGVYQEQIEALDAGIQLSALATPLFVPLIEEGYASSKIMDLVIADYLGRDVFKNIKSLILGCTHYPLIKSRITRFFNNNVKILGSSDIVAKHVRQFLKERDLLNPNSSGDYQFYVSDHTPTFETSARMFFGQQIHLGHTGVL